MKQNKTLTIHKTKWPLQSSVSYETNQIMYCVFFSHIS